MSGAHWDQPFLIFSFRTLFTDEIANLPTHIRSVATETPHSKPIILKKANSSFKWWRYLSWNSSSLMRPRGLWWHTFKATEHYRNKWSFLITSVTNQNIFSTENITFQGLNDIHCINPQQRVTQLPMWETGNCFQHGHRIRVEILISIIMVRYGDSTCRDLPIEAIVEHCSQRMLYSRNYYL